MPSRHIRQPHSTVRRQMHWGSGAAEKAMSIVILIVRSEIKGRCEHRDVRYVSSVPHIDAHRFCLGDVLELRALVL